MRSPRLTVPLRVGRPALSGPFAHVGNGAGRAVAIEDDQCQAVGGDCVLDAGKRFRGLPGENADRRVIAIGLAVQEVFHAGIADILADRGGDIGKADETGGEARSARWQSSG